MSESNLLSDECKLTVPMKIWIKNDNQKLCRSCTLPILVPWYISELEENNQKQYSDRLKKLVDNPAITPEALASELDSIKSSMIDQNLKKRLLEFDCTIQANESPQE
jgi:hypothetical protein